MPAAIAVLTVVITALKFVKDEAVYTDSLTLVAAAKAVSNAAFVHTFADASATKLFDARCLYELDTELIVYTSRRFYFSADSPKNADAFRDPSSWSGWFRKKLKPSVSGFGKVLLILFFLSKMTSSECSICFDDITVATGSTTLSCGHVFHFSCIANWFCNQQAEKTSCCLCRKETGEFEALPFDEEDEEDEDEETVDDDEEDEYDDDEEDEEDEEDEASDPARIAAIQERVVAVKARLSTMDKSSAEAFAATKIQSVGRLFLARLQAHAAYWNKQYMVRCEERLKKAQLSFKVSQDSLVAGRNWKPLVAKRVQAIWRGYRVRNVAFAMAVV